MCSRSWPMRSLKPSSATFSISTSEVILPCLANLAFMRLYERFGGSQLPLFQAEISRQADFRFNQNFAFPSPRMRHGYPIRGSSREKN
jgi:hypothetical protein